MDEDSTQTQRDLKPVRALVPPDAAITDQRLNPVSPSAQATDPAPAGAAAVPPPLPQPPPPLPQPPPPQPPPRSPTPSPAAPPPLAPSPSALAALAPAPPPASSSEPGATEPTDPGALSTPPQSSSTLPTERPETSPSGIRPSPFAGLLAEAGAARPPGSDKPKPSKEERRKHQSTLKIEGRGRHDRGSGRPGEPRLPSEPPPPTPELVNDSSAPAARPPVAGASMTPADPAESAQTVLTIPRPSQPAPPMPVPVRTSQAPPPPGRPSQPAPDARTIGSYRVLGELGSGGMAIVYKAVQPALDRLVALKELRPELVHDTQIAQRFEREATSLAALQHGNIVHIYDFIRDFETAYIVMEYVEGIDLFDLLADVERLPPDVAAIIALQLAEALEYAHFRGIIHRDIKPSNILVSKLGEVKIMDFGIARDPGRADLTQVGMALGTPAYMAPEQIRGEGIDFRADIFAFGIVLYEMLAGSKPWGEDNDGLTVSRKVLAEPFTPVRMKNPDVPEALERVIETCLSKDPEARFQSTHDLRLAVEEYVSREVPVDPRQRIVVFLKNRGVLTEGEASSLVSPSVLSDPVFRRRDKGAPPPPRDALIRPVMRANAIALALIAVAIVLSVLLPVGTDLPDERPSMQTVDK